MLSIHVRNHMFIVSLNRHSSRWSKTRDMIWFRNNNVDEYFLANLPRETAYCSCKSATNSCATNEKRREEQWLTSLSLPQSLPITLRCVCMCVGLSVLESYRKRMDTELPYPKLESCGMSRPYLTLTTQHAVQTKFCGHHLWRTKKGLYQKCRLHTMMIHRLFPKSTGLAIFVQAQLNTVRHVLIRHPQICSVSNSCTSAQVVKFSLVPHNF